MLGRGGVTASRILFRARRRCSREFSSKWKQQRDSDVYANKAIIEGLRSRAAYKLEQINNRFGKFLRPGASVIDLGAAPGGFSLVAAKHIKIDKAVDRWDRVQNIHVTEMAPEIKRTMGGAPMRRRFGRLVCIDLQDMKPIPGAIFIQGDLNSYEVEHKLLFALAGREADVVLSDMAPATTGEKETDHIRSMQLAEMALTVAHKVLRNGGTFCCKLFSGAEEKDFREDLRSTFFKVKAFKPSASRRESKEIYYIAEGFVPAHIDDSEESGLIAEEQKL